MLYKVSLTVFVVLTLIIGCTNVVLSILQLIYHVNGNKENLMPIPGNSYLILVLLAILFFSELIVGVVLVNRIRSFFKQNYFDHTQTVIYSIILFGLGVGAMLSSYIVEIK